MNVAVVYCHPIVNSRIYYPLAKRFAETWQQFPPGCDHTLYIGCNGGPMGKMEGNLFDPLNAKIMVRDNSGWDIGLFQWASENIRCDIIVCMGSHCHFHRSGWLERMVDAYVENGPHYYGCRGYFYPAGIGHHIRTTCFWLSPVLLNSYPFAIGSNRSSRYQFEHGNNSMTEWVEKYGFQCLVATWDGVYGVKQWKDGFGPVETSLVMDQWTHREGTKLDR